jgi:hypothetical protein
LSGCALKRFGYCSPKRYCRLKQLRQDAASEVTKCYAEVLIAC